MKKGAQQPPQQATVEKQRVDGRTVFTFQYGNTTQQVDGKYKAEAYAAANNLVVSKRRP